MSFHLGDLEMDELAEGLKERVPMEEEDPREAPHEVLGSPVARVEEKGQRAANTWSWERERGYGEEGNSSRV
jgi:hypothetical protein